MKFFSYTLVLLLLLGNSAYGEGGNDVGWGYQDEYDTSSMESFETIDETTANVIACNGDFCLSPKNYTNNSGEIVGKVSETPTIITIQEQYVQSVKEQCRTQSQGLESNCVINGVERTDNNGKVIVKSDLEIGEEYANDKKVASDEFTDPPVKIDLSQLRTPYQLGSMRSGPRTAADCQEAVDNGGDISNCRSFASKTAVKIEQNMSLVKTPFYPRDVRFVSPPTAADPDCKKVLDNGGNLSDCKFKPGLNDKYFEGDKLSERTTADCQNAFNSGTDLTNCRSFKKKNPTSVAQNDELTQESESYTTALDKFNQAKDQCVRSLNKSYKDANNCCVTDVKATQCLDALGLMDEVVGVGFDAVSMYIGEGSTGAICKQVFNKYAKKQKQLEGVYRLCKASKKIIEKNCIANLQAEAKNLIAEANKEADPSRKAAVQKAESLITEANQELDTLAESDLINTDTGDINSTVVSKWNYNLQTIARDAETASVDVKNLQTSTNTCTKRLTTSLALKKFIDEEKRKKLLAGAGGLQKSALGISPYDLAEIPTDTGGFQASKQGDGGDDDVSASNKAGSTGNTDGSGSGSKGDSSPSYASPGGLSSGGGSAGGQGGTASVGSAGSSSLLRGFRNKSYSSRVRVGGQGYSSRGQAGYGKKGSSYNKNSRKKRGKAFNLQAFLPGGKQDPNRRLASISGAGVDIFSVVRRKFKSSCYTKKLLDCK